MKILKPYVYQIITAIIVVLIAIGGYSVRFQALEAKQDNNQDEIMQLKEQVKEDEKDNLQTHAQLLESMKWIESALTRIETKLDRGK